MKVDKAALDKLVEEGMVRSQTDGELTIYCYTPECQFSRNWTELTRMARGIILDQEGNIVAKPFDKFFNLNEMEETKLENLPIISSNSEEAYSVQDKLDGSMISVFYYGNQWRCATKGSFANEYIDFALLNLPDTSKLVQYYTYVCEVVLPRELDGMQRVVTHSPGLYLLAVFNRLTGEEIEFYDACYEWETLGGGKSVKQYSDLEFTFKDMIELQDCACGSEGWVVKFPNNLRVKIKTAWYLSIFRFLENYNEKYIKELMIADPNGKWLADVPEELSEEVQNLVNDITGRYDKAVFHLMLLFESYKDLPTRKDFALAIQNEPMKSYLFSMLDGKQWQDKLLMEV